MFKSRSKILVISALMLAMIILSLTGVFAKDNNNTGWKVKITTSNGTKDLIENTNDITFEVKNNPNVASGKFAPGTTAEAMIQVDLTGTEYPVEISANIDRSNLKYENFELTTLVDGEKLDGTINFEPEKRAFTSRDGKKNITVMLKWNESENDTEIGTIGETIKLPITIKVEQHI